MDTFQALMAHQRVLYSSVNYKDALALTPGGGVVRDYPVVPGIDLAGVGRIAVRAGAPAYCELSGTCSRR